MSLFIYGELWYMDFIDISYIGELTLILEYFDDISIHPRIPKSTLININNVESHRKSQISD